MMQGRLWVDSEPDRGSCFHFTLPLRRGSGQATVVHELPGELRDLPVLVVDDNATNRRILLDLLRSWGMSPVLASDGAEALRELAQAQSSGRTFGLLLLDYMMPGMDGLELARRIAQPTAGQKRPRILLLSSAGHQLGEDERTALGIERVLTKPLKPSELFDAIAGTLMQVTVRAAPAVPVATDVRSSVVLLVDDGVANQMVAKAMLEKRGHRVTIASDGRQAIELTAERRFDVILMDVQMPGLDGYDATREIRQQEVASGIRNRIIAMTANAMKGDREKCLEAGMDDFLAKPVHAAQLFAVVEKAGPEAPASSA
jgi:CheY-like chemotaxis protein